MYIRHLFTAYPTQMASRLLSRRQHQLVSDRHSNAASGIYAWGVGDQSPHVFKTGGLDATVLYIALL